MLEHIYLRNFKAFREVRLDLAPITLLTGKNGLGKSTLIQSLLLIRQSYFQNTLLSTGLSLSGDLCALGRGRDIWNESAEGDELKIGLEWTKDVHLHLNYNLTQRVRRSKGRYSNADMDVIAHSDISHSDKEILLSQSLFTNRFQYLSADRHSPDNFFPASLYKVDQLRSLGKKGEYTAHFLAHHQREPVFLKSVVFEDIPNNLLSQCSAWLSLLTQPIDLVASIQEDLDIATVRYRFARGQGFTAEFKPGNVGFGFNHCLPIITAILSSRPGDLIIIDSPESHLHPQGQVLMATLIGKAAEEGVQIIVESHSDHVLNGFCVGARKGVVSSDKIAIYYFVREDFESHYTTVTKPLVSPDGRLSINPPGFFDEIDKQLDLLLD